jgi:TonB-dependent Receptor Plug Domain
VSAAGAQRADARAGLPRLLVVVSDTTGAPVSEAEVLIPALRLRRRTDPIGRLALPAISAGDYLVIARRFGFLPDSQRARLRTTDAEVAVTFRLRTSAHVLDTARIESSALRDKMVDFERRRASGRGTFITRDQIEQRSALTLADLLRTVRGLTIRTSGGRTEIRFARANTRIDGVDCPPELWLDGVRTFDATVDELDPEEVEGIELYRGLGHIPAEYLSRTAGCGIVAIWTRSPSRMPR